MSDFNMSTQPKAGGRGWIAPVALLLGVVGVAVSLWSMKIASDNAPGVKAGGDPKERVCAAFATASKAITLQTNGGAEPVPEPLAATNARQALLDGGDYLLRQIDAKTPRDLADAVSGFANDVQTIGMNYLGGATSKDPGQADLIKKADADMKSIAEMCK